MRALRSCLLLFLLALTGCGEPRDQTEPRYYSAPQDETRTYRFAIHPLFNPDKLARAYQPLIDYLNAHVPDAHFTLEASRDYAEYERKFRTTRPEFLLPNPWQTLQAEKADYHVIAMAGNPDDFKGIFIVRRDSTVQHPRDLEGKSAAYPSPTALAACIMPQWFLHEHGLDINRDLENRYVGSQESAIMNAYLGLAAVGVTWPPPWRAFQKDHPQEARELKVVWETPSLLNNSVMVRSDVPQEVATQVRQLLIDLRSDPQATTLLKGMETEYFLPSSDADYRTVAEFIARFEREVRPVESQP